MLHDIQLPLLVRNIFLCMPSPL